MIPASPARKDTMSPRVMTITIITPVSVKRATHYVQSTNGEVAVNALAATTKSMTQTMMRCALRTIQNVQSTSRASAMNALMNT